MVPVLNTVRCTLKTIGDLRGLRTEFSGPPRFLCSGSSAQIVLRCTSDTEDAVAATFFVAGNLYTYLRTEILRTENLEALSSENSLSACRDLSRPYATAAISWST